MGGSGGSDGGGPEALVCTLGSRSGGNLWDREYVGLNTLINPFLCRKQCLLTSLLSTSSTMAIGALSPFRLGILSTRVNPPGRVA